MTEMLTRPSLMPEFSGPMAQPPAAHGMEAPQTANNLEAVIGGEIPSDAATTLGTEVHSEATEQASIEEQLDAATKPETTIGEDADAILARLQTTSTEQPAEQTSTIFALPDKRGRSTPKTRGNGSVSRTKGAPTPYQPRSVALRAQTAGQPTTGPRGTLDSIKDMTLPYQNWGETTTSEQVATSATPPASSDQAPTAEYVGRHRAEDLAALRPDAIPQDFWDSLSEEEQQELVDFAEQQSNAPTPPDVSHNNAPADDDRLPAPVINAKPKGIVARTKHIMSWANTKLMMMGSGGGNGEKGRGRFVAGAVAGALAVAGAVYLSSRGHDHVSVTMLPKGGGHPPLDQHHSIPHVAQGAKLSLKPGEPGGDSIWRETVQYAHQHGVDLTEPQKNHIIREVVASNHQTMDSSRHLPVGYQFIINQHEQAEILNAKK